MLKFQYNFKNKCIKWFVSTHFVFNKFIHSKNTYYLIFKKNDYFNKYKTLEFIYFL